MRRHLLTLALAAAAPVVHAAQEKYDIDPNATTPEFEVAHIGFGSLHGYFDKASGSVTLDRAARRGSVELVIDTASVHMGSGAWTAQLRDPGLLDVSRYPEMRYRSDRLIFQEDQVVGAEGQLTLLGTTRPVFLEVANFKCAVETVSKKQLCAAEVSAVIKRSEFGLGRYQNEVSDEVKVRVPVEAWRE